MAICVLATRYEDDMEFDKNLESLIDSWIEENKESYLKDLASLIEIKSVSKEDEDGFKYGKGCHDVLVKAKEIASSYGFNCVNPEDKYLLIKYGNTKNKKIGIFNHLDVVPEGSSWINPPYKLTYKDGFVIGRGVADNKGAAIASLYALRYLKEHSISLNHPVELFYGAAEETGMDDIEAYKKSNEVPYFSIVPDTDFPVCHGEKGNMRFTLSKKVASAVLNMEAGEVINAVPAYATATLKGCYRIDEKNIECEYIDSNTVIKAYGKAGHAAFPEESDNAVKNLFYALSKLDTGDDELNKTFSIFYQCVSKSYGEGLGIDISDEPSGKLTSMGTILRFDNNTIYLSFDTRTPVTVSIDSVDNKIKEFASKNGMSYNLESSSSPSYTALDSDIVKLLCSIAEHIHKKDFKPYTMGGGTYCRKLPFALGFGPGLKDAPNLFEAGKGHGHQSDECILLSLLLADIKAAILALIGIDKII